MYRLREIEVSGFKSIQHARLALYPLTTIVGANSSGKSSLLQVILAISQAVRSHSLGSVFPLNGEYARFGTFDETANFFDQYKACDSGANIRLRTLTADPSSFRGRAGDGYQTSVRSYVDWTIELCAGTEASEGTARLDRSVLRVYKVEDDGSKRVSMSCDLRIVEDSPRYDKWKQLLAAMTVEADRLDLAMTPTEGVYVEKYRPGYSLERDCDMVELVGAVPWMVYSVRTVADTVASHLWATIQRILLSPRRRASVAGSNRQGTAVESDDLLRDVIDSALKVTHRWFEERRAEREHAGWRREIINLVYSIDGVVERAIREAPNQISEADLDTLSWDVLSGLLEERVGEYEWADELMVDSPYGFHSPGLDDTSRGIVHFFGRRVRYLGPLRKAPQVLYDPRSSDLDIGLSGEFTAAVLHTYGKHQVARIGECSDGDRVDLHSAVEYWLNEFDMARDLELEDRGRLGIGVRMRLRDVPHMVDLTSVGVGVSQVLPVVVLCLLSEPGDLVILEQPELHLHPALQHRLGDFLLECAHSGRQVLVETHSEHLVNRLRRRVAEESGWAEGLVGLLFAERNEGNTTFRVSPIDQYGGLEDDWPDGFFDVSAREAQALVTTSLTKRYRK